MLSLRQATADQCDLTLTLVNDAQAWLISQGSPQWPVPFQRDEIAENIERGEAYIAWEDGEAVGTLKLAWSDPLWFDRPQPSGYIHRLAVPRAHAGRGVSSHMLEVAAELARQEGKAYLRLDCWALNRALRKIYLLNGFRQVNDIIEWAHGAAWLVSRLERRLTPNT